MVFHGSLSDNKSPQVSRTLLSILADLNNAVVCVVSSCPLISKSFNPSINPLVTETSFSCSSVSSILSQGRGIYPSFHFLLILLCGQPGLHVYNFASSLFLLIIIRSGRLAEIK